MILNPSDSKIFGSDGLHDLKVTSQRLQWIVKEFNV
jgi:hypothetical protein